MGTTHTVTPLDQYNSWRGDAARRLAELESYREHALARKQSADDELSKIDEAIATLKLLGGAK